MICLYVTAVMGQDYGLCEEFLEFVIKIQTLFHRLVPNFNAVEFFIVIMQKRMYFLCNCILLTLGRDQEVYDFMKLQHSGYVLCDLNLEDNSTTFKNMVKNEGDNNCKENFVKENFFQWFLKKQNRRCMKLNGYNSLVIVTEAEAWLTLAVIKINVIEEIKQKLSKMKDFLKESKYRKKFRRCRRVLDTLAILHFGEDENSLMEELKIQEEQLDKLLTLMMKSFNGIELWPIWLATGKDCRYEFIQNYEKEDAYKKLNYHGLFALIKYFDYHPTTSNIILEYMKNKKGFPVEKNFYVSLSGLPQKSHYLFDDKTWACDCHDCMPRSRKKKNQIKNRT